MSGEQTVILGEDAVMSKTDLKDVIREVMREVLRDELPKLMVDASERRKQIEKAKLDAQDLWTKILKNSTMDARIDTKCTKDTHDVCTSQNFTTSVFNQIRFTSHESFATTNITYVTKRNSKSLMLDFWASFNPTTIF